MFITAHRLLFLFKLKWPKNKSVNGKIVIVAYYLAIKSKGKGKICIRTKWLSRLELIPVSLA